MPPPARLLKDDDVDPRVRALFMPCERQVQAALRLPSMVVPFLGHLHNAMAISQARSVLNSSASPRSATLPFSGNAANAATLTKTLNTHTPLHAGARPAGVLAEERAPEVRLTML